MKYKELLKQIVEISYKMKLSHVGSCLTALPIIAEIYEQKKPDEKFVLSAGHAHLAHMVVINNSFGLNESYWQFAIEKSIEAWGIHCALSAGCDATTGSLGHGIGIAVGMALADRSKNVYCLISDGECAEGSVWEALRVWKREKLYNLKVYVNWNDWAAYRSTEDDDEWLMLDEFYNVDSRNTYDDLNDYPEWLQTQEAHYKVLDEQSYNELMEVLK